MDDYIIATILVPVYILLGLLGRRLFTFARGYEKGLEDAEKIRKMLLDEIRAEILRNSYGGFELGEGFRDGYNTAMVRVLNILDKHKSESEK